MGVEKNPPIRGSKRKETCPSVCGNSGWDNRKCDFRHVSRLFATNENARHEGGRFVLRLESGISDGAALRYLPRYTKLQ